MLALVPGRRPRVLVVESLGTTRTTELSLNLRVKRLEDWLKQRTPRHG